MKLFPRFGIFVICLSLTLGSFFYCLLIPMVISPLRQDELRFQAEHHSHFRPLTVDLKTFVLGANLTVAPTKYSEATDKLDLVVVVTSSVNNFEARQVIRETWGKWIEKHGQQLYFLIGATRPLSNATVGDANATERVNDRIDEESQTYGDLIQYDFIDDYYNLTLKSLLMLRFFNENILKLRSDLIYISSASNRSHPAIASSPINVNDWKPIFLLKADDDMFVHIDNLVKLLKKFIKYADQLRREGKGIGLSAKSKSHTKKMELNLLMGCLIKNAQPIRSIDSKYYVPHWVFPGPEFPNYVSGTSYLMSQDVARSLYITALFTSFCPYFHLEDIYLTGICASKGVKLLSDYEYTTNSTYVGIKSVNNVGFKYSKVDPRENICYYKSNTVITAHRLLPKEIRFVWNRINGTLSQRIKLRCKKSTAKG